jgi:glucoamylase
MVSSEESGNPSDGFMSATKPSPGRNGSPVAHVISPDILALVRFGLRMPDDPRIADTLKVVDALLKMEFPYGPVWRRFNKDSYGEYDDGRPFDGNGKGRPWPLLVGERAHYELAVGRRQEAERLLHTMEACANEGGMIPEQIWDGRDIREKGLFFGRPSGSAMPLVWAHAEYLKLLRSLRDNRIFDLPPQTVQRYLVSRTDTPFSVWRKNHKTRTMLQGKILRIELLEDAIIHWSSDSWTTVGDTSTRDTGVGIRLADLPTAELPAGTVIDFTFYWQISHRWQGENFQIKIAAKND